MYDPNRKEIEIKRNIKEIELNDVVGKSVYSNNKKIGIVEDVYFEDYGDYKLLVKLEEEIAGQIGHKRISIEHKYILSVDKVIVIEERFTDYLNKF